MDDLIPLILIAGIASYYDLRYRRIPNPLMVLGGILALAARIGLGLPFEGIVEAVMGATGALACTLPFFLMGGLGAGDVKLLMVIGAFVGWPEITRVMLASLWLGGLFGAGILCWNRGLHDYLSRYLRMAKLILTARFHYIPPETTHPAARDLPFAPFIALGVGLTQYFSPG